MEVSTRLILEVKHLDTRQVPQNGVNLVDELLLQPLEVAHFFTLHPIVAGDRERVHSSAS